MAKPESERAIFPCRFRARADLSYCSNVRACAWSRGPCRRTRWQPESKPLRCWTQPASFGARASSLVVASRVSHHTGETQACEHAMVIRGDKLAAHTVR